MAPDLEAVLAEWLRSRAGAVGPVVLSALRRPGVGQSSDTVLFTASWPGATGDFVLRRQPAADGIFLRPDAAREFRVLSGLAGQPGVPVPRVRWLEEDHSVLGAPFFVMEQVAGIVPAGKPSIHAVGWLPSLEPAERGALVLDAIGRVAAVHAVDWRRTHAFLRGGGPQEPGLARHLADTLEWYRWTVRGREFAVVDAAMAYVLEHASAVDQGDPVLLWGDARAGNTMFDPRTHTVSALLDWENSCLGPAGVDLAHWLVFDEFATTATGVERLPGYPGHDAIVAAYEQAAGRGIPDLPYFEILQCLFVAITLIRQADRAVAAGRLRPESRMGHDNVLTQMLARRLDLPVPELDADYLLHRRPVPPAG